ncbi:MAG: hypothetical protein QW429_06735, partial [Thermoprotei archaeon]
KGAVGLFDRDFLAGLMGAIIGGLQNAATIGGVQNAMRDVLVNFFTRNMVFKATIQSGRRISIPEEEMKAAGVKVGDIVQVVLVPLKQTGSAERGGAEVGGA